MTRCPSCDATVSRPADEGGTLVRNRYLRVSDDGRILLGCPGCGAELEATRSGLPGRLVLKVNHGNDQKPDRRSAA